MTTVTTITEPQTTVTVEEEQITVSLASGVTDHGALSGIGDDDHTQYLLKAGGTMTGDLVLAGDPDAALKAATKQYVDNNAGGASDVGDLTTTGLTSANMLRVAAAGGLEERTPAQVLSDIGAAATSHDHDSDYVDVTGDTMTGALTLSGAPTLDLHAATKKYVDDNAGGGGASDVDDLTTNTGNAGEMVRVDALGTGLEYRTTAQVLSDIGAAAAADLADYLPLAGGTMTGAVDFNVSTGMAIDLNIGYIEGTRTNGTLPARLYLKDTASNLFSSADFVFAAGGLFRALEGSIKGTNDVFFQAFPSTGSGYGFVEAWRSSGLVLGTGGGGGVGQAAPILFQIDRLERMRMYEKNTDTPSLLFTAKTSTAERSISLIEMVWSDSTDATRKGDMILKVYDTAEREGLRIRADGTRALLITSLPTSDPGVTGALWNNAGVVTVS